MNRAQVEGILRILVPAICAFLAAHGLGWVADTGVQGEIIAAVLALASVVWSYFVHSDAGVLKQAAKIDPEIAIQVPPTVSAKDQTIKELVNDNVHWQQIQHRTK